MNDIKLIPSLMGPENDGCDDLEEVRALITRLYEIVDRLEELFPGRKFTPDGHMVGSIGECLARYHYGITLHRASFKGCDGTFEDQGIEVKATQGSSVAFRCEPNHLIVLKINRDGSSEEVYNGPGAQVWATFKDRKMPSNGQHQMSLIQLKKLMSSVSNAQRLRRVR